MKIAIAMSGGVDSSVAAKILKDQGHDLVGLFLKLWSDPTCSVSRDNRCCNYEALEDARMVAARLEIPFYVIDAKKEFKKEVVDYFLAEYKNLRTPNPCIVCNETIKFDLLLKKALAIGCEKLATGHYARIVSCHPRSSRGSTIVPACRQGMDSRHSTIVHGLSEIEDLRGNDNYKLLKGVDQTKDQSYMLYRLNQDQLSRVMFPLGGMKKSEVRKLAVKFDLPVKEKPESQEICFFADKDYRAFLQRHLPAKYFKSGDIIDQSGKVIGRHDGLLNYTIGQRKGIDQKSKISAIGRSASGGKYQNDISKCKNDKQPLYVVGFDRKNNRLIVGEDKDVYKKEMIVGDLNWIGSNCHPELVSGSLSVKIRYRHPDFPCVIASTCDKLSVNSAKQSGLPRHSAMSGTPHNDKVLVLFKKPQRAITPGQSAVFYYENQVIGGGIIES